MREIKFRGKTITGEWVYGGISIKPHGTFIYDENLPYDDCYPVIPQTVGQLMETPDRDGTPIYEGDLVELYAEFDDGILPFTTVPVTFENGGFCIREEVGWGKSPIFIHDWLETDGDSVKVVGNVFDNLDLLETVK